MDKFLDIGLIGSGNLAWHLGPALENCGHRISMVYSRNTRHARDMASRLYNADIKKNLNFSKVNIDVLIIAVGDNHIIDVVSEIVLPENCLLVHTSGSQPIGILDRSACPHLGVLYPLQTFSRGDKINFREVPCFIEANTDYGLKLLKKIGKELSRHVNILNSVQRRALHLSAVFASNFSNHMLTIAAEIMKDHRLEFNSLESVVIKTVEKAFTLGPARGQTGPAIRGDHETIKTHMEMLKDKSDLADLYLIISNHIIDHS